MSFANFAPFCSNLVVTFISFVFFVRGPPFSPSHKYHLPGRTSAVMRLLGADFDLPENRRPRRARLPNHQLRNNGFAPESSFYHRLRESHF